MFSQHLSLFFPGCNVYFQPEKTLNALDIMEAIGDDYAFIPGLDNCCGDGNLFFGDTEKGANQAESLIAAISQYQPETVVLWRPTCLCRIHQSIAPVIDCHYCNQSFAGESHRYDFRITNYVSLVAEAMGIHREDKFNKYAQWGDLDGILQDASGPISESSFDKDRIVEVLKAVFVKEAS